MNHGRPTIRSSSPAKALALALLLFSWGQAQAQVQTSGAGSTSTNFQKIGMGARATGMGNAFTGVSDDVNAVFWNPAGLGLARGTQFTLTHGEWLIGVTHEFFAFSQNIGKDGGFGGSVGYLDSGSFPGALETPSGQYGGVGDTISATNFTGTLAYAQRLGNWINGDFFKHSFMGISASVVGQNVVNVGNAGAAFNIGYLYEIQRRTFYVGAVLFNLGTHIQDFSQPLMYKIGGSYSLHNVLMKKDRNIFALDLDGHSDTGFKIGAGDEYKMNLGRDDVFLRLGYTTVADLAGITAGAGVAHRFDDFTAGLDYAFVPYGALGDTHRITLNMIIGDTLIKPEAYVYSAPTFVLGKETAKYTFSTKSEEPITEYKVTIYDPSGKPIKSVKGKGNPPSNYMWDGRDQKGELVPQGDYRTTLEVTDDNDLTASSHPSQTYAKWVPQRVPYQYSFGVSGDLLFDSGKSDLLQRGYDAIQKAAQAIRVRYPDSLIIIAGHTDDQPLAKTAKYKDNQELSLARAQAVMDYLIKSGMDRTKLSVVGYGDTKPIAPNNTPEGRAKNRRVELVVSGVVEASAGDLIDEGMIQFKDGNFRGALDRFLKAIEADQRNAKAYHLAGDCYLRLGGKAQAIEAYRKSLKWNPNDKPLKDWMDQNAPGPAANPAPAAAPALPLPNGK
ncbi:MAG TPA: PorV/PorQ family protein [bacterium]|nr:PorV/PorQ family protein [bacterium]